MSDRAARWLTIAFVAAVMLMIALSAFAQAPRLPAVEQYARDVKEHRDWLESQLAAAKARIAELQATVLACGNRSPEDKP